MKTCPRAVVLLFFFFFFSSLSSCLICTSWLQNRMRSANVLPGVRRLGHCSSWQWEGHPALLKAFSASPDSLCSGYFKVTVKVKEKQTCFVVRVLLQLLSFARLVAYFDSVIWAENHLSFMQQRKCREPATSCQRKLTAPHRCHRQLCNFLDL